jgi:carbon monoxide dehydrogenase subunit G
VIGGIAMKFHLDGIVVIQASPEKTFSRLSDPSFMVTTIPDMQSYKIIDNDRFEAKIKVGISVVRGTVDMKFEIKDKTLGNHARLVADGSGAGSKMHVDSTLDLAPDPAGTKMSWSADAEISGLMAGIGSQILKGQSEKQVGQIFSNIKQKIESP